MIKIEIFTSKSDKYYKEAWKQIVESIKEISKKEEIQIRSLDVENRTNGILAEKYIQELERKMKIIENPVRAIPLIVVNNKPIVVGVNPEFKELMKKTLECELRERYKACS